MLNVDLTKLPAVPSDASLRGLGNLFGVDQYANQKALAYMLALLAAGIRIPTEVAAGFTRPSDTTAYASGDLVANSTTAGSVVPIPFKVARTSLPFSTLDRVRLLKSGTSVTNASFRLHFYTTAPTPSNGDNGVWLTTQAGYLGAVDVTVDKAFSDGAAGIGAFGVGLKIPSTRDTDGTVYGLLEARGAYTPISAEVFTATLELSQA